MDDRDWCFVSIALAYIIGAIAFVIDSLWLLLAAMFIVPIILMWRAGDERQKKKSA